MISRRRRGLTLIEVVVTIALILAITAVVTPMVGDALGWQQRGAAQKIAALFEQLHDAAILQNKTFRVIFDLAENTVSVEVGSSNATIFDTPEAREEAEDRLADDLDRAKPEDLAKLEQEKPFEAVSDDALGGKIVLPENTRFLSVYTPQYEDAVTMEGPARKKRKKKGEESGPVRVASHVFANGFAEHTVVQIVDKDDTTVGFTITVDPLSGRVSLLNELVDHKEAWRWLPDKGPSLNL